MERAKRINWIFITFIFLLSVLNACVQSKSKQPKAEATEPEIVEPPAPKLVYGLPVDSFLVETGVVKNNQYLSQILNEKGVGNG